MPEHIDTPKPVQPRMTVVVIGNGMASHAFCQQLVERAPHGALRVIVYGDEAVPAYNRVRLSEVMKGRLVDELLLAPSAWYAAHDIELHLDDAVVHIDRAEHVVHTSSGKVQSYDRLVLATGSSPWRPPVDGIEHPGCQVYRSVADLSAIEDRLPQVRRAVVIGGGLLGLEAAKVLLDRGVKVSVVEAATSLMHRQLDAPSADLLRERVEALGVHVHAGSPLASVEHTSREARVVLADGRRIPADLVVVAAGVRPNDELARDADLACNVRGGIVVDARMITSDPEISAIGECVSVRGTTYGLYAPCRQMATVAAANLLGEDETLGALDNSCRLKLLGVDVVALGDYGNEHRAVVHEGPQVRHTLLLDNGVVVGAIGVGAWPSLSSVEPLIEGRVELSAKDLRRFERTGRVDEGKLQLPMAAWSDAAIVCNCNRVSAGTIRQAAKNGACDVPAILAKTGATGVCGSCTSLVAALVGDAAAAGTRTKTWGIAPISVVAFLIACVTFFASPIAFSTTVEGAATAIDRLWRDPWLKQVSGFTLVGLAALGLVISLRKRWSRFSFGSFALVRSLHAVVGVGTLFMLLAHTGFRLGHNLNLWLMVCFLVVNIAGAAAGLLSGLEARAESSVSLTARRLRRPLSLAHITTLWPLPLLLVWHVVAVYYF